MSGIPSSLITEILDAEHDSVSLKLTKMAVEILLDKMNGERLRRYDKLQAMGINTLANKAALAYSMGLIGDILNEWILKLSETESLGDIKSAKQFAIRADYVDMSGFKDFDKVKENTKIRAFFAIGVWTLNDLYLSGGSEDVYDPDE